MLEATASGGHAYDTEMQENRSLDILTINRHTGYLYNLAKIGHRWSVLDEWVQNNRPLPTNFKLIDWHTARQQFSRFDAVVGHDIRRDIARFIPYCLRFHKPYVQVLHGRRGRGGFSRSRLRGVVKSLYSNIALGTLVRLGLVRLVFISPYARSDWSLPGTTINQGIPLDELGPYEGREGSLLTVGNMLHREHFAFDLLMEIGTRVPLRIVGDNPQIPGCSPSRDWCELRSLYSRYRAYLNLTREPEDGYNLAVLEAMASGMPVIALKHPSTPIRNGENGFLVEDASEAVDRAKLLIADIELARRLGKCARATIEQRFPMDTFRTVWNNLLSKAVPARRVHPPSE